MNNHPRTSRQIVQLVDGKSPGSLDIRPKHLTVRSDSPFLPNPVWICEIDIHGYRLPQRSAFNDKVLSFDSEFPITRVSASGIAYVGVKPGIDIDEMVAKPTLSLTGSFELFSRYFEEHGYEIDLSDKGAYQERTVQRFGGISSFLPGISVQNEGDYSTYFWPRRSRVLTQTRTG